MKDLALTGNWKQLVCHENLAQLEKWGVQNHDAFQWLAFLTEELGELSEAISEWYFRGGNPINCVHESTQIATLALKIGEMFQHEHERTNV